MVFTGCRAEKTLFQLAQRDKDEKMDGVGEEGTVETCDPLPLGDSVLGRGKFPSLRVMHRGSS